MLVLIASGEVKAPCGHHRDCQHHRDRHLRLQLLLAVRNLSGGDALVDRRFLRVHFANFS